jgi:hypothetical protein
MSISIVNISRFWLYSGVFSGWWCYDPTHYKQLNMLYMDHCKKTNTYTNEQKSYKKPKSSDSLEHDEKGFEMVDFSEDDSSYYDSSDDDNVPVNYILTVGGCQFKIDMTNMKQINTHDLSKQRKIKYIDIPSDITDLHDIINLLISNGVKGIAGTNFSNIKVETTVQN